MKAILKKKRGDSAHKLQIIVDLMRMIEGDFEQLIELQKRTGENLSMFDNLAHEKVAKKDFTITLEIKENDE